jgi:hypothetical protein
VRTSRGPVNIGGRTKALAIDVHDENVILAGGVSSGMWKSADGGKTWKKTTAPGQLHSVSCIAQNTASGYENVWYYGTGEGTISGGRGGSAAGPISTNAFYHGDGVFKSADGGETWSILPSTVSGTVRTRVFRFVFRPVTFGRKEFRHHGGVYRSVDGERLNRVLGEDINVRRIQIHARPDVAMTGDGPYALPEHPGSTAHRSLDGSAWENISHRPPTPP